MLITIEGGEGAGKSTLIRSLQAHLHAKGAQTLSTHEPGGTALGQKIRELLLEEVSIDRQTELFLFLADRSYHVETLIRPALKKGAIVLCDRFYDSTTAYQGAGRGLGMEHVEQLSLLATGNLIPDLTFYIDIHPEIGLGRCGKLDRIEKEKLAFHIAVREAFLSLVKQHARFVLLDGSASIQEVALQAIKELDGRLI